MDDLLCSSLILFPPLSEAASKVLSGQPGHSPQRQEKFGVPRDAEASNIPSLMAVSCSSVVPFDLCRVKIRLEAFDADNFM